MEVIKDRDPTIEEILATQPAAAYVFFQRKMACVGCAMARFDTLHEAALSYGIPEAELWRELVRLER